MSTHAPPLPADTPVPDARPGGLLMEQTAGTLLRNIGHVMREHFGALMLCGVLPIIPGYVLMQTGVVTQSAVLTLIGLLVYFFAVFLGTGALTIAISDICLGHRPAAGPTYRRVLSGGRWKQILMTGLMTGLGMIVGMLLLVLPGLWFFSRVIFASTIVVLERRTWRAAITRSFELTKGQAWRLSLLLLLPCLLAYVLVVLVGIVIAIVVMLAVSEDAATGPLVEMVVTVFSLIVVMPAAGTAMVLLYYDQRVRREAYDAVALAEDLMR